MELRKTGRGERSSADPRFCGRTCRVAAWPSCRAVQRPQPPIQPRPTGARLLCPLARYTVAHNAAEPL